MHHRITISTALAALSILATTAAAQVTVYEPRGNSAYDQFGWDVSKVGDVDQDGVEDFAVGAPFDGVLSFTPGVVRLYSGRTGAVLFTWLGAESGDEFGASIAPAGDFDDDGRVDVLVGSPGWNSNRGRAVIYSGATGASLWQANGAAAETYFGTSVALIGRCDADLEVDFAVGAPHESSGGSTRCGVVRLYSGANGALARTYTWGGSDAYFGMSLAGNCDWNGDGRADLVVGSPLVTWGGVWRGAAHVFSGTSTAVLASWYGDAAGDQFGFAVAGLADVDGDGRGDVLVGAPYSDANGANSGRAVLLSSSTNAVLRTHTGGAGDRLGYAVDSVADADFDLVPDYVIGSPYDVLSGETRGAARIHRGADGVIVHVVWGGAGSSFGRAVADVGDLNDDGFHDVAIGASTDATQGTNAGAARVVLVNQTAPTTYGLGKLNSAGCRPSVEWSGTPSLSIAGDFHVRVRDVLNHRMGMFFWGFTQTLTPFGGGYLLVGSPIVRTAAQPTGGSTSGNDCTGTMDFHFSHQYMAERNLLPGTTIHGQFLHRDQGFEAPNNLGLSNAVRFTILP